MLMFSVKVDVIGTLQIYILTFHKWYFHLKQSMKIK